MEVSRMSVSSPTQQLNVVNEGIDVKSLKAIELATGWHDVQNCALVQFVVGEAESPITPQRTYSALRYNDESGRTVFTPMRQILSYSSQDKSFSTRR
jgi:hypothetical protein